jgi:uncharacterized protein
MRSLVLLVALMTAALVHAAEFPRLSGRVVDAAGVLGANTRADLDRQLEAHERATGQQIVVATVPDLAGLTIEEYGYQLGRAWGIGSKERNTGVVLIVAPAQRKVRIEVGYGLEGDLTDAVSSYIISTRIVPEFRRGNYDAGVRAGVSAIIEALGGQMTEAQPQKKSGRGAPVGIFWLIVLFIVLSGFGGRRGGRGGIARAIVWGSVLNGMSRGGGRSGGGGFGGGGFRGGGGSFGGGGASGSW